METAVPGKQLGPGWCQLRGAMSLSLTGRAANHQGTWMDTEPGAVLRHCAAAALLVLFDGNVATWCGVGVPASTHIHAQAIVISPWQFQSASGVLQGASWALQPYLHAARPETPAPHNRLLFGLSQGGIQSQTWTLAISLATRACSVLVTN